MHNNETRTQLSLNLHTTDLSSMTKYFIRFINKLVIKKSSVRAGKSQKEKQKQFTNTIQQSTN